jgi:hypothetical protein
VKINPAFDLTALIILPLIGLLLSVWLNLPFFFSSLLYGGLPAIYLSISTPRVVLRAAIFSIIFFVGLGILLDHLAVIDRSWYVPTIFPFRILGNVPIEDATWAFVYFYLIIMFYEHFFDRGRHKLVDQRFKLALVLLVVIVLLSLLFYASNLSIPYFYLWLDIIGFIIPATVFIYGHQKIFTKVFRASAYFFALGIIYEITALRLGWWKFPGTHFIGWITIFGNSLPIEEFLAFVILPVAWVITYYDFFDDSSHIKLQSK